MIKTLSFVETATGATYTASTAVPAGGRIVDVLLETTAAWTAATAPVDVGDSDATDALVAAFDLAAQGGTTEGADGSGTDWGNGLTGADGPYSAQGAGKFYPDGDTVTAVVSPTVPGGPTGISRVVLWIELDATTHDAVVV